MFATAYLMSVLACLVVLPVVGWLFGLAFRVLGWTLRGVFAVLGVLLMPVWIVLMVLGGVASVLPILIPVALVWLVVSALATD